ncbi:hypothetical protein STEG23_000533, partial [Scotinomys teguina]
CDRCWPLYNDKPFHSGDGVHAFNCKPCLCNNHARSCHYDASVDPFPLEHSRGSGGVCDNCQHHTTGRNCESCQDYFYRPVGADPSAPDVCKPCDCHTAGTRNGNLLCDPMSSLLQLLGPLSSVRLLGHPVYSSVCLPLISDWLPGQPEHLYLVSFLIMCSLSHFWSDHVISEFLQHMSTI